MKNLRSRFSIFALVAALALAPFTFVPQTRAADIPITASSVACSPAGQTDTKKAVVPINAGQVVYLETSSNSFKLADANLAGAKDPYGIAVNSAAAGQYLTVCFKDDAFVLGGTLPSGAVVVLSATAGGIAPVADLASGMQTTILGVGIGSNKLKFNMLKSGASVP